MCGAEKKGPKESDVERKTIERTEDATAAAPRVYPYPSYAAAWKQEVDGSRHIEIGIIIPLYHLFRLYHPSLLLPLPFGVRWSSFDSAEGTARRRAAHAGREREASWAVGGTAPRGSGRFPGAAVARERSSRNSTQYTQKK